MFHMPWPAKVRVLRKEQQFQGYGIVALESEAGNKSNPKHSAEFKA